MGTFDIINKMINNEGAIWIILLKEEFHTAVVEEELLSTDVIKMILDKSKITEDEIVDAMSEGIFEIGQYDFRKITLSEWNNALKEEMQEF